MQELQKQLERLGGEHQQLETRITELLPYQSEVARLKGDLVKMQVRSWAGWKPQVADVFVTAD